MRREHADLIAYNAQGRPVLVVEAKNKLGTSRNWAAQMRHWLTNSGLAEAMTGGRVETEVSA
jgi:hypothetical protein